MPSVSIVLGARASVLCHGMQPLEQEDRLIEMVQRPIGVDALAEKSHAGLRHVLGSIGAERRERGEAPGLFGIRG